MTFSANPPTKRFETAMPSIRFFLATPDHPIDRSHPLWNQPLPNCPPSVAVDKKSDAANTVTYADYFSAVANFCTANAWDPILRAIQRKDNQSITVQDISQLAIFLEKHGALYHPARIQVSTRDRSFTFVVNVAVSSDGRRTLPVECKALIRLGDQRPFDWLPSVYSSKNGPIPMFLADWFDDYHEFHLTRKKDNADLSLIVWDGADPPQRLSEIQKADLYRQAAMILTACYDPITTEQIFPWHHAAGDFVVRVDGNAVDVKLITVRGYAPIFIMEAEPADERALLDNLITFFVHLSIQMRLDRLDGVSEMVWAPENCLAPTIDGFFKGLDLTGRLSGFPDAFPSLFQNYFIHQNPDQLMPLAKQLMQTVFGRQGEIVSLFDLYLERHFDQVRHCIKNQNFG